MHLLSKPNKDNDLVDYALNLISEGVSVYVSRGSIYSLWWFYWQGATKFQEIVVYVQAALSLDQVSPFLTDLQKRDNSKPRCLCVAISCGTTTLFPWTIGRVLRWAQRTCPSNVGRLETRLRRFSRTHPQFLARFESVLGQATGAFMSSITACGAPKDSPHYAGALIIPATDVFRQLQVAGYADVFARNDDLRDRLTGLGEWLMQILTPKQARFGNRRKMIAQGDGYSEGHDNFLSMIMGFEDSDLRCAKRMAGAWADMGQPMSSFYASSALKIRHNFPTQDMALGDADFPGWMTVMRSGWGTANESSVHLLHGRTILIMLAHTSVAHRPFAYWVPRFAFHLARCIPSRQNWMVRGSVQARIFR